MTYKGYSLSFFGALFAAIYVIPYKKVIDSTTPDVFVLGLLLVSLIANTIPTIFKRKSISINKHVIWGSLLFALLTILGNYACGKSLEGLSPPVTVVVLRTQVLFVMFLGWFIFKEKVDAFLWIGGLIALLGIVVLSYSKDGWQIYRWLDICWAFLSMVSFALINIVVKIFINKVHPITFNFLRLLFSVLLLSIVPGCIQSLIKLPLYIWLMITLSALAGPVFSRIFYIYALKYIPISKFVIITAISPVLAIYLSWFFLHDIPSSYEIYGGSITILGILIPAVILLMKRKKAS